MILIKFELKSNSIGLASTKNANLQIAQAMKQKCIFCCFKFLSMIPDACNADFKLRARVRAELLKCQFNQLQMPMFSCSTFQLLFVLFCLLPNKPLAMYGETLLALFFHESNYRTNFNVFIRFRFEFDGQKLLNLRSQSKKEMRDSSKQ